MNILFIGSSSDFHIDLWAKYFTETHNVYLFSEKEDYLTNKPFHNIEIIYSSGIFGWLLNYLQSDSHRLFQLNKLISTYLYSKIINKIIDDKNIDIVHAHNLYQGFIASFIKRKTPIVFTPMGSDVILHAQNNFIYRYMAKRAFKKADIVTSDSKLLQKKGYAVGAKKDNNYIIQNGVDSKMFFPKENGIKKLLNIEEEDILLFSPRGLDDIYNIEYILKSISELRNENYTIRCMISYGFGEAKLQKLKKLILKYNIEDNIIWIGSLEYHQMPEYYNAADIVLSVPSSDSSPKSVYEAMFCEKPVIVSDIDWVYENLEGKNCILKVNPRDSKSLKEAISLLVNDKALKKIISKNAKLVAIEYYDYHENMRFMESLMFKILRNTK